MDTSIALIVMMGSQVCASVQTHEIIRIKYVQGFVPRLSLKKGIFFLKREGGRTLARTAWFRLARGSSGSISSGQKDKS